MFRLPAALFIACSVLFLIVYLAPVNSVSQGTHHSLSLNGTSSYVSVPNSSSINISGPITVEAWIKLNSVTGNYQDIVCRESWGQAGTGGGYEFAITSTGKVRLDLYQSHNQYTTVIGATTVTTGTWHHVAGVFDGSQMRVYLNGVLDGSLSTTNGPAFGTSPLNIGKSTYTTYYFGGLIDEVRISAAALYSSSFTPGLGSGGNTRALWRFDGQTANDSSGNANHGTLQGGATYSTVVPTTTNNAPTVSLTDPLPNTAFAPGSTIVIDATASDGDGIVTGVDFYQGTTLLGSDTSSPYTFVWNNVPAGSYSLTAKATDDIGATTTSSAITVNVESSTSHSLSLNGTSSYMSVPNSSSINISGPITVEAWIKLNSVTGNYQDIVCRESWGQAGTGGGYEFAITSTGKVRLDLYQSHNQYTTVIGATTVTSGTWHHVAGVFDGSQMRVYLNGVLDGSLSTTNGPASGTSPLNIGKSTYTTYYFGGLIDEVRLSAAALYSSNFTPGLGPANQTRALWKFDGQTANDSSGNGNSGTLQGGATYSTTVPTTGGSQRPVSVPGGPYNSQLAQSVQFSSSGSFDPDGTVAAYHWNFGDGTSANTMNPAHSYQTSGVFTATLTLTDNSGLLASATTTVSINGSSEARLDPKNATGGGGENPLSRNFSWNLPLVSLPGRAGFDLNLSLSYNSLIWTKKGSTLISFDDDHGFPSPGFRLGFPTIQSEYLNAETGKWSYVLIASDGSRTELRRVPNSTVLYESADSSHLLLDTTDLAASDPQMILRPTDGTQLTYKPKGGAYECTEIKDRNGNYITINYNSSGRIANIHDTLDRVITFNYDNGALSSITQQWKRQPPNQTEVITHTWATFEYSNLTVQPNFISGLTVLGPTNPTIKVLSRVTLDDNSTTAANNSHFDFEYTAFGQVWKISNFAADNHLLNYRAYKLPNSPLWTDAPAQNECPRFTERLDWGQWANGDTNGTPAQSEEIVTSFSDPVPASWTMPNGVQHSGVTVQVMAPDGTFEKIYFADTVAGVAKGWLRGLPGLVESYDINGTVAQRQAFTSWEQNNENVSYELNPRVKETNILDPSGNRKRTTISYAQFTPPSGSSFKLPQDVFEYAADATTILRSARTDYVDGDVLLNAPYLSRRIFGLVKEKRLYQGNVNGTLMSRIGFSYDESASIQGSDSPVQHDNANYPGGFKIGRGNVSTITRYDVLDSGATTSELSYNTAGAVVSSRDALDNEVKISYADSFSDSNNSRGTFAYPTTVTDPDNYYSTTRYNFDFGSVTYRQTPPPNATAQPSPSPTPVGPAQTFTYDDLGRLERTTNLVNNAYTRYQYPASKIRTETFSTLVANEGEAYSFKILDGFGRAIASASDHPATTGTSARFDAQRITYDVMGRVMKTSNPAETSAIGDDPAQWQLVEGDAGSNWQALYTQHTYDWKGRPTITTNTDATTKSVTYEGCGCAGGEVVTLTDEGTIVNGVTKTRQEKIYSDVLGRTVRSELWNFEGTGPSGVGRALYSTTVTKYNARDQVILVRQFKGAAPSDYLTNDSCPTDTCQKTELTYDGHGRVKEKHVPEQQQNPYVVTRWTYNADDTVNTVTDGRGAVTAYDYGNSGNKRRLVKAINYTLGGSLPINVSFDYDAAGNRTSMLHKIDGIDQDSISYTYDQLSRLTSETRHIEALANSGGGNYSIGYQYTLAGQVSSVTDPFSSTTSLNYDAVGRTESVTGSYSGVSHTYANDIEYRAWGAVKRHGTKTITYNNRLQPTRFRYSQYRYDYNYHPDGRLKQLIDLDDVVGSPSQVTFHYMSRSYGYDLAGRISRVDGTDNPVVNGGTVPAPFVGYYGYDEFNNLNSRSGHYALNADTSDSATFFNNKRTNTGWNYDADGRALTSVDTATSSSQTWTYDAAGRQIGISEVSSGTTSTNTVNYDGDGELLHESVTAGQITKANYLIRSTVLGTVLTKLDASGNKDITYVPANGLAFPMQTKDGNGNPIVNEVRRDVTGLQEDGKAVDPFGAVIQNVQPPTGGAPPNMAFYGATYGGVSWNTFTNANNFSSGCRMDGVRTDCNRFRSAVQNGIINPESISLSTTGGFADFFNSGWGGLVMPTINRQWASDPTKQAGPPQLGRYQIRTPTPENRIGPDGETLGHWEYSYNFLLGAAFGLDPQDINPPYIQDHKDNLCSLRVDFTGKGFMQTNGPGEQGITRLPGLAFTASGTVMNGTIGRVERGNNPLTGKPRVDIVDPKGSWTLQQWVWISSKAIRGENRAVEYWIEPTQPDGPSDWFRQIEGNNFVYADAPGIRKENSKGILISADSKWEFAIKLINGSQQCEVRFRINMSYQNGHTSAQWWRSGP